MNKKQIKDKASFLNYIGQYNIQAKYEMGQNFLYDESFISEVLNQVFSDKLENVLEIGSGAASLSRELAKRSKKLVTIEIDSDFQGLLEDFSQDFPNTQVILTDVNHLDLSFLFTDEEKDNLSIVANLPYYITSELISQCITELSEAQSMLFLVQEEAAARIVGREQEGKSQTKNRGWLYHFIKVYGDAKVISNVPAEKFYPEPRVDSQFVLIEKSTNQKQNRMLERHADLVLHTIKLAFSQRRKTLLNCFEASGLKNNVGRWLEQVNKAQTARAEELSTEEFLSLTQFLFL